MVQKKEAVAEDYSERTFLNRCPVCEGGSFKPLTTPGHWADTTFFSENCFGLDRCRKCGIVFTNPRPSQALLTRFYSGSDYAPHESDGQSIATIDFLLSRISYHHPGLDTEGRFLDFGCGGGRLLREAVKRFRSASGYDVAPPAIESCRSNGVEATSNISELPPSVNAILMCHSLEHVPDPETPLRTFARILKPDTGRLFIAVPNTSGLRAVLSPPLLSRYAGVNERYFAFPIHLWHFSANTLTKLLIRYGFECVAMETYAFGIDCFFRRSEGGKTGGASERESVTKKRQGPKYALKQKIKVAYMGLGLGDNLLGVFMKRTSP